MGSSASMYVGPVAVFDKIPKVVDIETSTEPACVNPSCARYEKVSSNTRHCSECGKTMGSVLVERSITKTSSELLEDTEFEDIFRILNQDDDFNKVKKNAHFLDERLVIGAIDDDLLSDGCEVDNYSSVLYMYSIEDMMDLLRRFADKYATSLDNYISILGPYKLVWSANIASS